MDHRQFFATVLVVILLGISVAMGVNMVVGDSAPMQNSQQVDQQAQVF